MKRRIRKSFTLSDEQDARLRHVAAQMGLSQSEIVRMAITALARTYAYDKEMVRFRQGEVPPDDTDDG